MKKLTTLTGLLAGAAMLFGHGAMAQDCEELVLGSAISLTGKYATNGLSLIHI